MDAIINEADFRSENPIGGCLEEMCKLQNELELLKPRLGFSSSVVTNDVTTIAPSNNH